MPAIYQQSASISYRVQRISFDHSVRLYLEDDLLDSGFVISIGGGLVCRTQTQEHRFDADSSVRAAPVVVSRLFQRVASVSYDEDGILLIRFEDGVELIAIPDEHYESWDVCGPGVRQLICCPGGKVVEL